jgi:hypothetical protein
VRVIQSLVTQVESFDWLLFHMRVPLGSARIMGLWPHRTTQSFASIEFLLDREPLVSLIEYRHAKR